MKKIAVWLLATMFILSGLYKLAGSAALFATFASWGYPAWFAYVIGGVELTAGLMLLVPHVRVFGAFVLTLEMFGALFTHWYHGETLQAFLPLIVMGFTGYITYAYSGEFFMNFKRLLNWHQVESRTEGQPPLFQAARETINY